MLSVGIVGLPNVGKSTLFKALTKKQVDIANFPFCTIEPNVGVVEVPDARLEKLSQMSNSQKTIPTAIEFIDIAGLVEGASKGEGLGNQFLAHIRETDAIVQVVRAFEDENIVHISGQPNPEKDAEVVAYELILKDLETLQKHLLKAEKDFRSGSKNGQVEFKFTKTLIAELEKGRPTQGLRLKEQEEIILKNLNLLSSKPVIYALNCSSQKPVLPYSKDKLSPALEIDMKLENELSELAPKEAAELRQALPHPKNSLDDLISACYALLKLETFFTTGQDETRAWTITQGSHCSH